MRSLIVKPISVNIHDRRDGSQGAEGVPHYQRGAIVGNVWRSINRCLNFQKGSTETFPKWGVIIASYIPQF